MDLSTQGPDFNSVQWTAPESTCYTGIVASSYEARVRNQNDNRGW